MGRPRRSEATRETLLDQGLSMFLSHGYHGTGLSEVLASVRVPKGSFYNYFESKDAFVAAVVERYGERLLGLWDGLLATFQGGPLEALRFAFGLMIQSQAGSGGAGCLVGNLAGEIASSSEPARAAMSRVMTGWSDRVTKLVGEAQAAGTVRDDRPARELADLLLDAWEGGQLRAKIERSRAPLERAVALVLDDLFLPRRARDEPSPRPARAPAAARTSKTTGLLSHPRPPPRRRP
ncbi:MAG TPA: TetR family transcriptional regulator C-terminal domain-containing protein [Polyangiaceae bacterium]|nr:TetR family transcriptional regulator C-terminal domain-containing protein [Polyangiaceae bacterium]